MILRFSKGSNDIPTLAFAKHLPRTMSASLATCYENGQPDLGSAQTLSAEDNHLLLSRVEPCMEPAK